MFNAFALLSPALIFSPYKIIRKTKLKVNALTPENKN